MQRARQHPGTATAPGPPSACWPIWKLAVCGLVLVLSAGAAAPQPNFDCGKAYKDFWEKLERETYSKMPPEQLVILSRRALRIYDACQTGDVEEAKGLFERLVRLTK
jgi:hypothetical protein